MARLLIEYGAGAHHGLPIKGNGERGTTSLQEAAAPGPWAEDNALRSNPGKIEVARILIKDGADYDAHAACGLGDAARLRALVNADRAAAHAADDFGMVPLHWAARAGSLACIRVLLDNGARVDAANKAKRTPVQLAAEEDRGEAIRLLAAHGANLSTQDTKGRTPLHRAAYQGKLAAINALLASSADPTVRNKTGKTAFEVARKEARYLKPRA
jgi:ankyrin repeat protein